VLHLVLPRNRQWELECRRLHAILLPQGFPEVSDAVLIECLMGGIREVIAEQHRITEQLVRILSEGNAPLAKKPQ